MAPVTELLIVAHGAPSEPGPQEEAMADLAARVETRLPGGRVIGATLAAPGAVEAALARLERPMVYPFFMAKGWFVGDRLPARLAEAGRPDARVLDPFGLDDGLPDLILRAASEGAEASGYAARETTLLLAAHGSAVSRGSAIATSALAGRLAARGRFRSIVAGFVEEDPGIAETAAAITGPAVCVPLFALTAGHVLQDVPEALDDAGFAGRLLPPIGAHPEVAQLISAAALRAARVAA